MKIPHLGSSMVWGWSIVTSLITISAALLCLKQQCQAQQPLDSPSAQQPLGSQPDASFDPLKDVNWVAGPQKVNLGDVADFNIPSGYRFTDVHGARMILANINNPMPDDLAGILAPATGKWMAILEYAPRGYIKNPDAAEISTNKVLKELLNQINEAGQSITDLRWQTQPVYNTRRHLLEWSLQLITPISKVLNQTDILLGRHGVLQITVVQHFPLADASSLRQVLSYISFKPGERYADYKNGDKVAEIGLAELMTGEKQAESPGFLSGGFGSVLAWIYSGLAVCVITGATVVVLRGNKARRQQAERPRAQAPIPAPAINSNGHAQPKPVPNRSDLAKPFRRRHRKRVYDYTKFYTKVIRNLSPYSYVPSSATGGHVGYHGNHNSSSHSQDHCHAAPNVMDANQTTNNSAIEELITAQKSLIEGQKSLLEQQARLIEEKRRLIEEQTAFLKSQSGTAPNQRPCWPENQQAA